MFSLIYREAIRNAKVESGMVRAWCIKRTKAADASGIYWTRKRKLRATILKMFAEHLPEMVIALGAAIRI